MKTIVSFLLVVLTGARSLCQELFFAPPAQLITAVPFRILTGGIVMIKVQVGEHPDSLNFVLDTGSGGISLDSATASRLDMKPIQSDRIIRGIAGVRKVRFCYDQTLHLPGLSVDSLDFHINDYEVLTSSYGEKIDGIVGYALFSKYIVKIDYDSSRLFIFSQGNYKYPRGGLMLRPLLVGIPIVDFSVADERMLSHRFYFDTGAGMCLLLSTSFVNDSSLLSPKRKWVATQAEGLGGKTAMRQGIIRKLKLGPYRFRRVPTYVFDDEYNITAYPYLGGLLGNDLLRRFNVVINYASREIYLSPNSHFREPFDYSYTGLGIYKVNGQVVIEDVMPQSPGEKAGFKPGDIILAIDNNFSGNIQLYKTLLQSTGQRFRILVMRGQQPLVISLKVGRIF